MRAKAFALDDLVINDGEDWPDAVWVSILRDTLGLPKVTPSFANRQGRRPKISGVNRSEVSHLLETIWASGHDTYRPQLMRYLNPDPEQARRLLAVDHVPPGCAPDSVLLMLGPWDVYQDDAGAWHVRDLLQPDDVEVDISGTVHFEDGKDDGQRAIVIEPTETNDCAYPRMKDTDSDGEAEGWTITEGAGVTGSPTYTVVDHDVSVRGWYQRIQYTGQVGDAGDGTAYIQSIIRTAAASYGAGDDCTLSLDVKGSVSGVTVQIILRAENAANGNLGLQSETLTLTSTRQRVSVTYENLPATTDHVWVAFYITQIGNGDTIDTYFGAVNIEDNAYGTSFIAGNLGPGYIWASAADASISQRTETNVDLADVLTALSDNDTFSVRLVMTMSHDHDGNWHNPNAILFDARGSSNDDRFAIYYNTGTEKFDVYINGAARISSSAQTFDAGDDVELVVACDFSADSYALFVNGAADGTSSASLTAPTALTDARLGCQFNDSGHGEATFSECQIFDHALAQEDVTRLYRAGGANRLGARWLDVWCAASDPWAPKGRPLACGLVSGLVIDGDVRWRQRDGDVAFWRVYDDTGEITVTVEGNDEVYPQFRMTPKTAKTTGFDSKYWIPIKWPYSGSSDGLYPVLIAMGDLSAVAQADGDDVRVYVDGEETDRWLGGTLVSDLNVWFNTTFQANQEFTLDGAILIGDTVTEITVDEDISDMPSSGILLIDSEAFYYDDKDPVTRTFSIASREYQGTSAAGHADDSTVYWIQHDVAVYCGDPSLGAPDTDDSYKPVFDLDNSTNDSWVYDPAAGNCDGFGYDYQSRTGRWTQANNIEVNGEWATAFCYTATGYGSTNPWDAVGIIVQALIGSAFSSAWARFYLHNPCGITDANFQTARYIVDDDGVGDPFCGYYIRSAPNASYWVEEYSNFSLTVDEAWHSWSRNEALTSGSKYVSLEAFASSWSTYETPYFMVEATKVTITLNSSNTPDVTVNARQDNYPLAATITNAATGESITISCNLLLDQQLVVDTDPEVKTVVLSDGTRMPNPTKSSRRRDWLRLLPGDNVLSFSDTGTVELEIEVLWTRRLFE